MNTTVKFIFILVVVLFIGLLILYYQMVEKNNRLSSSLQEEIAKREIIEAELRNRETDKQQKIITEDQIKLILGCVTSCCCCNFPNGELLSIFILGILAIYLSQKK